MSYPEKAINIKALRAALEKMPAYRVEQIREAYKHAMNSLLNLSEILNREALEAEGRELLVLDNERKNAFEAAHAMHRSLFEFAFHDGVRPRR